MRIAVVLALLLGCNSGEPDVSSDSATGTATGMATGTATAVTDGGGCVGNGDCSDGEICIGGVCAVSECQQSTDCAESEYCNDHVCEEKLALGAACAEVQAGQNCVSGLCGKINGSFACVAACEWGECHETPSLGSPLCGTEQTFESCKDPCRFVPRPRFVGCEDGYLCVGGIDAQVIGSENGHYCWPQDANDFNGPGAPCPIPAGPDMDCITSYCGFDSVCAWSCKPDHPNFICPLGMTCVDRQDPFEFFECI